MSRRIQSFGFLQPRIVAGLVIVLLLGVSGVQGDERVLHFPADQAIGFVTVGDPPARKEEILAFKLIYRQSQRAQGDVHISGDAFVGLKINEPGLRDLTYLERIPGDAIQSLHVSKATITRKQMEVISTLKSLQDLSFSECRFAPNVFRELQVLPQLIQLTIDAANGEELSGSDITAWVAQMPQLENLYCRPALRAEAVAVLRDHPALRSINIDLTNDVDAVWPCLRGIPSLKLLNIQGGSVTNSERVAKGLAQVPQLGTIVWFQGFIDGAGVQALAKGGALHTLRLMFMKLGPDFSAALPDLKSLQSLEIRGSDSEENRRPLMQLPQALLQLPQLREWPDLESIDQKTFDQVIKVERLESLSLRRPRVPREALMDIALLKNLRRLDLEHAQVDDDWLRKMSSLHQLEQLHLFATGVTGAGFDTLSDLTKLWQVRIYFEIANERHVRPALQSLSALPALESLDIGGMSFRPDDLEPIGQCQHLRYLRIWGGGLINDSVAKWVSRLTNLTNLTLGDNCFVSDKGAAQLTELAGLQNLFVEAALSEPTISRLAAMPSLRSLVVCGREPLDGIEARLRVAHPQLQSIYVRAVRRSVLFGEDGFLRTADAEYRTKLDPLEGQPPIAIQDETSDQPDLDRLASHRGKVVLIDFWGTWCGPCRVELAELEDLYAKYHEQGLEIVGVHTANAADKLPAYLERRRLPWSNIVDREDSISNQYGVKRFPTLFLVDRKGILRVAGADSIGLEASVIGLLSEPR